MDKRSKGKLMRLMMIHCADQILMWKNDSSVFFLLSHQQFSTTIRQLFLITPQPQMCLMTNELVVILGVLCAVIIIRNVDEDLDTEKRIIEGVLFKLMNDRGGTWARYIGWTMMQRCSYSGGI